jgi:hypothetical protein
MAPTREATVIGQTDAAASQSALALLAQQAVPPAA